MNIVQKSSFYIISIVVALCVPSAFAFADGSLTVTALSPSSGTVSVNTPVTFSVVPSGITPTTYTISDDVGLNLGAYLSPSGSFSWTPYTRDAGTHNLTITATDGSGNSASVTQAISVIVPTASLSSASGSTYPGVPVTFQITTTGFSNPTYWLGDNFYNGTLSNAKLNSAGALYWVPTVADVGTHKVMISVSDTLGHYSEINQEFIVGPAPKPEVQSLTPGTSTPAGATVSFSVTAPGYTSPTFSVFDSYSPGTINSANMNAGVFTWVPNQSQIGLHNIRIMIVGSDGRSTDVYQTIVVEAPLLFVEGSTGESVVQVGDTAKFMIGTKGLLSPTFTTSDSHPGGTTVTSDSMSASGLFVWVPTMGDVGLHNIGISAVDVYGNYASVRKDIRVLPKSVAPIAPTTTTVIVAPTTNAVLSLPDAVTQKPVGYVFTKTLAVGSLGSEVSALQQVLVKLGFLTVAPTGTFGPMTASAVKKFQSSKGLEPVGFVGPGTRAKLNALGATSVSGGATAKYFFTKPLALGASGGEVQELQKRLIALGFLTGIASGTFDTATLVAVKKFQASKGLEQVGSVGPATRSLLNAS